MEKSNQQACFQMTLNARKSCTDSFLKIKINDNRARFSRNPQNSEKFDSETLQLWPVNLSEKRPDIVGYVKRRLSLCKDYNLSSFCHNPTKCNDRVINGLVNTKKFKTSRRSCK